jgi:cobalt/nickel transport system permease protein
MSLNPEHRSGADSWLARRDPRWLLIVFGLLALAMGLTVTLPGAVAAFAIAIGVAAIAKSDFHRLGSRLAILLLMLLPFVVFLPFTNPGESLFAIAGFPFSSEGLILATTILLKTLAVVTTCSTLFALAPPQRLFPAARSLRIPGLFVQLAQFTYRYIFLMLDELGRLRIALRVRAFRNGMNRHSYNTIGRVTGTLLVRGYERSERVAHAMRCRGFDGQSRTLTSFRTASADVALAIAFVAVAALLVCGDRFG